MKRTVKILLQVCSTPKPSSFSWDYVVKLVQKHLNSSWKNRVGKATDIILLLCLVLRLLFLFTSIYSPSFWQEKFSPVPDAKSKTAGLGAGTEPESGHSVYSNPCIWSDLSQGGPVKTQFWSSVWTVGEREDVKLEMLAGIWLVWGAEWSQQRKETRRDQPPIRLFTL